MRKHNSILGFIGTAIGLVSVFLILLVLLIAYVFGQFGFDIGTVKCTESHSSDCPGVCILPDSDAEVGNCELTFPEDPYYYIDDFGDIKYNTIGGKP